MRNHIFSPFRLYLWLGGKRQFITLALLLASMFILSLMLRRVTFVHHQINVLHPEYKKGSQNPYAEDLEAAKSEDPGWNSVPHFQIYLRMSSYDRFLREYDEWFLRSYSYFFPMERVGSALVIALDEENPKDHDAGKSLHSRWPHPEICYIEPNDQVYSGNQRFRMFWDQFYPEKCIETEYVAYVDSDTVFTSMVTPKALFYNQKPIVIGHVGPSTFSCWPWFTEYWLGHKEALQCMTYFPVVMKIRHIIELRQFIARRFGTDFDKVYEKSPHPECLCQFSVMCNYMWYYHREEYHFRLHMAPKNWDGKFGYVPSMERLEHLLNEDNVPKDYWTPTPRVGLHGRYILDEKKMDFLKEEEAKQVLTRVLKEGRCYSGGFDFCPSKCVEFNKTSVYKYIYFFEYWSWTWNERCRDVQNKYYEEVRSLIKYYFDYGLPFLGATSREEFCRLLT